MGQVVVPCQLVTRSYRKSCGDREKGLPHRIDVVPTAGALKNEINGHRHAVQIKKRVASRQIASDEVPTSFLLECFNPGRSRIRLSLTLRSIDEKVKVPIKSFLNLTPDFIGFACRWMRLRESLM